MWKDTLSHKADILCIQKTHFVAEKAPVSSQIVPPFFGSAEVKKMGVMIAVCDSIPFQLHSVE